MVIGMEILKDKEKLNFYIEKFNIYSLFEEDMTKCMQVHVFENGEIIYRCGEKIEYIYFLVEGKTKAYSFTESGKVFLLDFSNPLDMLGDLELLEKLNYQHNVESVGESILIGISIEDILMYLSKDVEFYKSVCKFLSKKLSRTCRELFHSMLYPLINRFATYLVTMLPENEHKIEKFSLSDTAFNLGCSDRHLSRIIKDLSEKKIISKYKSTIFVLNKDKLEELSIKTRW